MHIIFRKSDQHQSVPAVWSGSVVEIISFFDKDDSETAQSTNSGRLDIKLTARSARFALPLHISRPHPDLIALIALKLFSPYIGSSLTLEKPVSSGFARAAKAAYKNLKKINHSPDVQKRSGATLRPAVSFSGGVDSVAAASALPDDTPLIQLARMDHPALPGFEKWYKTEANVKTLGAMPESYPKYTFFPTWSFCQPMASIASTPTAMRSPFRPCCWPTRSRSATL